MKKRLVALMLIFFVLINCLLFTFSGCSNTERELRKEEASKAAASLDRSRPENAGLLPDLSGNISDIRMTILDREYDAPSFETDFQNLSMMQIWYGYNANGIWYDYPSENYDLIGILEFKDCIGWKAALGSHMVKIGPYLLVNICVQNHPQKDCKITDTLNSPLQEPFAQYNTYHYYYDEDGQKHTYLDDHSHGYGSIAENPNRRSANSDEIAYNMRCEFVRRFYLILDYESIPDDYVLTVSVSSVNTDDMEEYTLTTDMIRELLNLTTHAGNFMSGK